LAWHRERHLSIRRQPIGEQLEPDIRDLQREHRSINTLQGLKRKAVERGLLNLRGQGRPGGDLIDKARALLARREG